MRAKTIDFERGQDPKRSMGIGVMNNPKQVFNKFLEDFKREFEIELKPDYQYSQYLGLSNKVIDDVWSFKLDAWPNNPIEALIHEIDDRLVFASTSEAANEIMEERESQPGWYFYHKAPSQNKMKPFYFENAYFLPEVLKKVRKLRKCNDNNIDNRIQRKQKEIKQLEKLKTF
jgi:hypothetical protein